MEQVLKYLYDEKGLRSSVLVPINRWEDLNSKYDKLRKKMKVLTGIQKGLQEIEDARKTGKKLQTLNDFLNESNS